MNRESELAREQSLFCRCIEQPPSEWERVLKEHCDDPGLRERVRRLLSRHRDTPMNEAGFLHLSSEDPGSIGPYRILRRLAEGGMGIVYAAEQREPVRRTVAVKVLRAGYGSREVLARFDVERQALALMNHANIARILDAGTTSDLRPFIVMEYVPGETITRYCEQRRLPLRERLALFRNVCEAVQHAHQKGVIHRDLKPSNILVMEDNGRPVAKIIDFGIAKAVAQRLTDRTLDTRVGSLLGTPDYMSPEQAELSPMDVDTRADVYALGAVLYQLLTGVPPLDLSAPDMSFSELQRVIREVEPALPSRRVAKASSRPLRGELDWIVMKALAKERTFRYPTPSELAADLARYLANDVVSAGPPSRLRNATRFVQRHWLSALSVTAVIVTLALSQLILLEKNRELERQRALAETEARTAEEVTRFLVQLFELSAPESSGGKVSARELLDRGRAQIEASSGLGDAVRVRLYSSLGDAYEGLQLFSESTEVRQRALGHLPADASAGQRIRLLARLASSLRFEHRTREARQALATAVELQETIPDPDVELSRSLRTLLASVEMDLGNIESAQRISKALYEAPRTNARNDEINLVYTGAMLAHLYWLSAEFAQAEALLESLLQKAKAVLGDDHPMVFDLEKQRGHIYAQTDRREAALEIFKRAHERLLARFGPDAASVIDSAVSHAALLPDPAARETLLLELLDRQQRIHGPSASQTVITLIHLGESAWELGRAADAMTYFGRALAIAERAHGAHHLATYMASYHLAVARARNGEPEAALELLDRVKTVGLFRYRAARETAFHALRDHEGFQAMLGSFATVPASH